MKRLNGKRAFIIGAARGLGAGMAARFACEGAIVGCCDLNQDVETVAKEICDAGGEAYTFVADVTDQATCKAAVDAFAANAGGVDILTTPAMWIKYEPLAEITPETTRRMLSIGVEAVIWSMQAAVPHMQAAGGGSIINFGSPAGVRGLVNGGLYCGIKGAIAALTRAAAAEYGRNNIRVNAIAPGPTPTGGAHAIVDAKGWERRLESNPMGRLGTVEDQTNLALFLASDESAYISGEHILCDGGKTNASSSNSYG